MLASRVARNKDDIIRVCSILAEQENLKVTIVESGKGALMAAAGVFIGGLVAGPIGMAVGGSVTSIAVAMKSQGKFKSVVEIIDEMSDDQKRRLSQAIQTAIRKIQPQDCVEILTLVLTSASVKELVLAELGTFLRNEMQFRLLR